MGSPGQCPAGGRRRSCWSPRGCGNAELASRGVLSEATVKTHMTPLAKLELRDRVRAVIYVYENGFRA